MTDDDFERFLSSAMEELHEKQTLLAEKHGLGTFARWWFDQETEMLDFMDEDGRKVLEASVIDIGSFAQEPGTWKWAWANDSLTDSLRDKASSLKALADQTGFALFAEEGAFDIDGAPMAWELAAVSVRHLGALGVYRAPSSKKPLMSFLAIMTIRRVVGASSQEDPLDERSA